MKNDPVGVEAGLGIGGQVVRTFGFVASGCSFFSKMRYWLARCGLMGESVSKFFF